MPLPYASSTAGQAREKEIRDTLRSVGATAVGFMVDDDADQIIAQFRLHGREITIPVRVGAYAEAWLRENERGPRTKPADHEAKARTQAERAAWAIMADWIKAQAAMMAAGFLSTDAAFLPHIHLPNGQRVGDAITATDGPLRLPPPPDRRGAPSAPRDTRRLGYQCGQQHHRPAAADQHCREAGPEHDPELAPGHPGTPTGSGTAPTQSVPAA